MYTQLLRWAVKAPANFPGFPPRAPSFPEVTFVHFRREREKESCQPRRAGASGRCCGGTTACQSAGHFRPINTDLRASDINQRDLSPTNSSLETDNKPSSTMDRDKIGVWGYGDAGSNSTKSGLDHLKNPGLNKVRRFRNVLTVTGNGRITDLRKGMREKCNYQCQCHVESQMQLNIIYFVKIN